MLTAVCGLLGTIAIDGAMQITLMRRTEVPINLLELGPFVGALVSFVIVSPPIETLIMAAILGLLSKVRLHMEIVGVTSALLWGAWHGYINDPVQILSMIWLFWLLSRLYLFFRTKYSAIRSMAWVALAHALNNLGALLLLAAGRVVLG